MKANSAKANPSARPDLSTNPAYLWLGLVLPPARADLFAMGNLDTAAKIPNAHRSKTTNPPGTVHCDERFGGCDVTVFFFFAALALVMKRGMTGATPPADLIHRVGPWGAVGRV